MKTRRCGRLVAASCGVMLVVAGCSFTGGNDTGQRTASTVTVAGVQIPTLDPQIVGDGMWLDVQGIYEGLVVQNATGDDVLPGLAEKWDVSADGLSYTFHLRSGLTWSDGSTLNAQDFGFAYKRLLAAKSSSAGVTLGANSYVTSMNIKGADAYLAGTNTDWNSVGVKIPDDSTVTMQLAAPNPGFLMGMTHPSMLPLPQKLITDKGADWEKPGNIISDGPFKVSAITPNTSMTLVKNDKYWDAANVKLQQINYKQGDATAVPSSVPFTTGEVDLMPLAGPLLTEFTGKADLKDTIKTAKPSSTGYLALMHSKNPLLQDARIREALSLGMGRDSVAKATPGTTAGITLVPSSLPDWSKTDGVPEDVAKAKQLLSDAGFPGGKGLPTINLLAGGDSPTLQTIVSNWKNNLGVLAKVDVVEAGVYVKKRAALSDSNYVGFYFGTFAAELTWSKWVASLWSPQFTKPFSLSAENYAKYLDLQQNKDLTPAQLTSQINALLDSTASPAVKNFEALTRKALATTDVAAQPAAFSAASLAREKLFIFIPVYHNSYRWAVNSRVSGFNPRGTGDGYYFKSLSVR